MTLPTYAFACTKCEIHFDRILKLAEYETPQVCPECGASAQRLIGTPGFILVGDGWPSKAGRIRKQMQKKNERLESKTQARVKDQPMITLTPNVGGERVDSWGEAQKLAASKGKDASTYDAVVRKERGVTS